MVWHHGRTRHHLDRVDYEKEALATFMAMRGLEGERGSDGWRGMNRLQHGGRKASKGTPRHSCAYITSRNWETGRRLVDTHEDDRDNPVVIWWMAGRRVVERCLPMWRADSLSGHPRWRGTQR